MSKPDLLLLDEPFSNIDQSLKEEIQVSVKKLLKRINLTTIIVTHDSYEAFSMADKCGIILDQELKQYDIPYNVHHEPNSIDVANFLNKGIFIDMNAADRKEFELIHEKIDNIKSDIDDMKQDMFTAHGRTEESLKFIKENLFNPHEGLWAETKQNTQFRENSQKWRGIIGIGFIGLVIDKVWSIFT